MVFIKEVVSFVQVYLPDSNWKVGKNYAILFLNNNKKSICFICNSALKEIPSLNCHVFITEFQWHNNTTASKSRLCSLLGVTQRIHARQCVVKRITKIQAAAFLETNHTMGYASSYFNYALFLKDQIVALACFSKGRKMNRLPENKKSFELIRFCNINFYTVVGGLSKLLHKFEEDQNPGDIMTYVDSTWGEPYTFYALGFVLDRITPPLRTIIEPPGQIGVEYLTKGNYKLIKYLP